jgi:hypothetical protein
MTIVLYRSAGMCDGDRSMGGEYLAGWIASGEAVW